MRWAVTIAGGEPRAGAGPENAGRASGQQTMRWKASRLALPLRAPLELVDVAGRAFGG